jgi:4-carboxymuconolactone decarboxylase
VQKQIVGADRVDAMYANAPADEMHLQRYCLRTASATT